MSNRANIEKRAIQAAETALHQQQYVCPIDIFVGMGLLQPIHIQEWRKGKIPYLEKVIQGNLSKISFAMKSLRKWAREKNLKPSKTIYLVRTKGPKKEAQFSKSGDPSIEEAYSTHYISPALSEKKQQQLKEKLEKPPELISYIIISDSQCSTCKTTLLKGSFLFMEADHPLCLNCAGFTNFIFLPSGDAQLTRRTTKYSEKHLVVVKFSRARKRYERQGILVTEDAFQKAQNDTTE